MRHPPIAFHLSLLALVFLFLPIPSLAQFLGIPSLNTFKIQVASSPTQFFLPPSGPSVTLSVALCTNLEPLPRFFISSVAAPNQVGPDDPTSTEIQIDDGVGVWSGEIQSGATVAVYVGNGVSPGIGEGGELQWSFELAVQEKDIPAHGPGWIPPILGDTTSTQAIIFSPPFASVDLGEKPQWPNYTLPSLRPEFTPPPFTPPSGIIILPTPANLSSLPFSRSACALRQIPETVQSQLQYNISMANLVRDPQVGWQVEFLVPQGLTPSTNYSVWLLQGPKISGPLYMLTKSAGFSQSCAMTHALSYCPLVAYPIPVPPPSLPGFSPTNSTPIITEETLPQAIASSIIDSVSNFSIVLSTFPCGRDVYSPLHGCAECFDAYRAWACFVSLPRCTEPLTPTQTIVTSSSAPSTSLHAGAQVPFGLKTREASSAPRAVGFTVLQSTYTELLPCIETCNVVRRTCPPLLQWKCPVPSVNANESYALGVWDSEDGLKEGGGLLGPMGNGSVSDVYGRIWCNGA
ncbi:stretch-activated cation channel mid1 [Tulasnella sp. 403]|nr:stretch-activated cation channel mid1 [Tulasnella sp. 403]